MNRAEAKDFLRSTDAYERLQAARYFLLHHRASDRAMLKAALEVETLSYIRLSLKETLDLVEQHSPEENASETDEPSELVDRDDIRALAIEEITTSILHEVSPMVGHAFISAEKEIGARFAASDTRAALEKLRQFLEALHKYSRAAAQANLVTFDLAPVIRPVKDEASAAVEIKVAGPDPFLVVGDLDLIQTAVRIGLSNAAEAVVPNGQRSDAKIIVVNWGDTDDAYWISILDRGIGLPPASQSIWKLGTSNKPGHLGAGLTIAQRAMKSLGGEVTLTPRENGGTKYELRWPKSNAL